MYQHTLDIFVIALPNNWDKILELGYKFIPCALGPDWRREPQKHSFEYPVSAGQGPRPWPKAENSPSG